MWDISCVEATRQRIAGVDRLVRHRLDESWEPLNHFVCVVDPMVAM